MPLRSIVIIVLRLFCLLWLVQGIAMFATVSATVAGVPSGNLKYWSYLAPALMLVFAALVFIWSNAVARLVTPASNESIGLGGLSVFDLYCFAFTFLGLYFVLSSLGSVLNWSHYYLVISRVASQFDPQRERSFYQLTEPLVTVIAGTASLLFAPRLARKLTQLQRKGDLA